MNRGIFRLWITCSIAWLGVVAWMIYAQATTSPAAQALCFDRPNRPANPFDCFDGPVALDMAALVAAAKTHVFTAFLPIIGALAAWMVIRWIANGFRSRAATDSNLSA